MGTIAPTAVVQYPSGDGKPMAETWLHVRAIMWLHQALEDFFQHRPDVFIASDNFWYWEEGNPSARIAPDVMVIPGVQPRDPRERRSFFSWKEQGAIPAVVFEMASRGTVNEDLGEKFWKYEELGVREYFLFDPEAAHLMPVLQGFRLNGTSYRRIIPLNDEIESELGFRLRVEDTMLRVLDARTGQPIPTRTEAVDAERDRADTEKLRADALESEVDRLKALLHKYGEPNGSGT